jgi:hypothetical protein
MGGGQRPTSAMSGGSYPQDSASLFREQ